MRGTATRWGPLGALLVSIGLGVAVLATPLGTGAMFANGGTADGNAVQAGVLDPKLNETGPTNGQGSTTDEKLQDVVSDTWEDTAHDTLGTDNVSNTVTIATDASTLDAARVNVSVGFAENDSDADDGNGPNTSRTIEVTGFVYDGTDLVGGELTDQNGNDRVDVEDLTLGSNAENLTALAGVAAGGSTTLTMHLSGSADLIAGVGSADGIDVSLTVRAETRSFVDADRSVNNTIQYA